MPLVRITIAAIAVLNSIPLFAKDDHFKVIARHSELKLFSR